MARGGITGIRGEMGRARKEAKTLERAAVQEVKRAGAVVIEAMFRRTPVWEGTTVRNFVAGIGSRPGGGEKAAIDNGPPGPTNDMAIGEEPRRAPNESAARGEMQGVLKSLKKLQDVFFTNNAKDFDLVDAGAAPGGPGQKIRNPGGVMLLAKQLARAQLGGLWK